MRPRPRPSKISGTLQSETETRLRLLVISPRRDRDQDLPKFLVHCRPRPRWDRDFWLLVWDEAETEIFLNFLDTETRPRPLILGPRPRMRRSWLGPNICQDFRDKCTVCVSRLQGCPIHSLIRLTTLMSCFLLFRTVLVEGFCPKAFKLSLSLTFLYSVRFLHCLISSVQLFLVVLVL